MTTAPDTGEQERAELSPAMAALPNDKWRNLVVALFDDECPLMGHGRLLFAAREAGLGTATSSSKSLGVMAGRICRDKRTQAAIAECSIAAIRGGLAPDVVKSIKNVARDPKHRDHARILALVYDRLDPVQTLHTVKVEDHRPASPEITQKVLDRIDELARRAGLLPPPQIIDGECSDVTKQAPA
jgi:hypothetical protein